MRASAAVLRPPATRERSPSTSVSDGGRERIRMEASLQGTAIPPDREERMTFPRKVEMQRRTRRNKNCLGKGRTL